MTHLFVSDSGDMFNTEIPGWHTMPPLRQNFKTTHRDIATVADLKATLRSGQYAWPGGYPLYFITSDGAALSFEAVRDEFRNVMDSIQNDIRDGWKVVGCQVNYEDGELTCDHTGKPIPSAYGEDEEESAA